MKSHRWLRILLRIAIAIVSIWIALYIASSWYASSHEQQIIKIVSTRLKERISGNLQISDVSISLFRDFPRVSVVLHDISLQDSLYERHKKPVLQLDEVRVEVAPFSLLSGKPRIRKLHFVNGLVDIFTDSTGYSNVNGLFLKSKQNKKPRKVMPAIELTNVAMHYTDKKKNKLFQFDIQNLLVKITEKKDGKRIAVQLDGKVEECNFNITKGSFLKNKKLSGRMQLNYSPADGSLSVLKNTLKINKVPMQWQGRFMLLQDPVKFSLEINGSHVMFHEVTSMLSPAIASKLAFLKVYKPVDIKASIVGKMMYRDTPDVLVNWKVKNNELMTPVGKMENAEFEGYYSNHRYKTGGHTDMNSLIVLRGIKATWLLIPFRSDSVKIFDLQKPYLQCNVNAAFPAKLLNPIIGGESFLLGKGNVMVDVNYKGRVKGTDSVKPSFNGYLSLDNVSMTYLPRNLVLKKCNALLEFKNTDIIMKNVFAQTQNSTIVMDGVAKNFFNQFNQSPDSIAIQWNVQSDFIDFNDFSSFLQPRKRKVGNVKNSSKLARNLDKVLDVSTVDLGINVANLRYRQFMASNISADVTLESKVTELKQIVLAQSGGKITVSGNLKQQDSITNSFGIVAKVNGVDVQKLFYSFENFGQDALLSDNLRGTFSANVSAAGLLQSKGKIVPHSITGTLDFELKDGALVHFKPFEKLGKIVFKKRNLGNVTFKNINNTFTIDKNRVLIAPMLIESSALNIKVAGVFGFDKGTDISLEIPLRNPNKDDVKIDDDGQLINTRGLVLYLKAIADSTGNVKITWDRSKQK